MLRVWCMVLTLVGCTKSDETPTCAPTSGTLGPFGIVVDATYIYWTYDEGAGAVWRQPIAGGEPALLATIGGYPRAMTRDTEALYIAGGCDGYVWRVPFGGGVPTWVAHDDTGDSCIHGTAVSGGDVYYTTGGVLRVPIAAGLPTILVEPPLGGFGCNGSIAVVGADLYWVAPCSSVDAKYGSLNTLAADGTVSREPGQSSGDALAFDANAVYWAADGVIKRRSRTDGTVTPLVVTDDVFGIAVDATSIYWTTSSAVQKAPLIGGAVSVVARTSGPAGIAIDDVNVYWGGGNVCPAGHAPK